MKTIYKIKSKEMRGYIVWYDCCEVALFFNYGGTGRIFQRSILWDSVLNGHQLIGYSVFVYPMMAGNPMKMNMYVVQFVESD